MNIVYRRKIKNRKKKLLPLYQSSQKQLTGTIQCENINETYTFDKFSEIYDNFFPIKK